MNYGQIIYTDVANGIGCRTSLFVSGCTHHCKGCFNEMTWDFNYGEPYTKDVENEIVESLKPDYINGLTILGGEPMEIVNQKEIRPLLERIRLEERCHDLGTKQKPYTRKREIVTRRNRG